jgi:hypothetical protein
MHNRLLALPLFLLILAGCATPESGPTTLFNGRNLEGWVPLHGGEWSVEEGAIVGRRGVGWSTNPEISGSWLRTEKTYGDFILELEYAINQRGNSGIFIRSGLEQNPAFTGHEMQILDDHGRQPARFSSGALYDSVSATKNMSKPAGEWNQVKIVARGSRIEVHLNGEMVVNFDSDRRREGYIGLQNHDERAVIKFRNIRVTEL